MARPVLLLDDCESFSDEGLVGRLLRLTTALPDRNAGVLTDLGIDVEIARALPEHLARRYGCLPLDVTENTRLRLAIAEPFDDIAIDDVRLITGYEVDPLSVPRADIERAIDYVFGGDSSGPDIDDRLDRNTPFPLHRLQVDALVSGPLCSTTVTQRFYNPYDAPVTAVYLLPVAEGAAVHSFRIRSGDSALAAEVKAWTQSHGRYRSRMADEVPRELFMVSLGEIPAHQSIDVETTYATFLERSGAHTILRIPLPLVRYPGMDLAVRVTFECGAEKLREVCCTQPMRGYQDGDSATFELEDHGARFERDLVLRWCAEEETSLLCDSRHFLVTVAPPRDGLPHGVKGEFLSQRMEEQKRDLVLLVDRSSSMGGWKLAGMKAAVSHLLDTLSPRDRFVLTAFNDACQDFEGGRPLPPQRASAARAWLAGLKAEGGTNLLHSLRKAIERTTPGRTLCVVLITDGAVGNHHEVRALVERHRGTSFRLSILALECGENDASLRHLAQAAAGGCETATCTGPSFERALNRIARHAGWPEVCEVAWVDQGLGVETQSAQSSATVDVYACRPARMLGRLVAPAVDPEAGLLLHGFLSGDTPWSSAVRWTPTRNPALAVLWAQSQVRALESCIPSACNILDAVIEQDIVELALQYRLLTKLTALTLTDGSCHDARILVESAATAAEESAADDRAMPTVPACTVEEIPADKIPADKIEELANEAAIVRVVNLIISQAIHDGATHVHLQPDAQGLRVRYRVDGTLHDVMSPPSHIHAPVVARLRHMAGLTPDARHTPQGGIISVELEGRAYRLSVHTTDTDHGERVTMRVWPLSNTHDIARLEFPQDALCSLSQMLAQPQGGLYVLCGPRLSGCSTTLRALLVQLAQSGSESLLISNQPEPTMAGVTHLFAPCASIVSPSAAVEHDVDVLAIDMAGDTDAVRLAFMAARQGRRVIAYACAEDASVALAQLVGWSGDAAGCAALLRAVLAQRLVRRLCRWCSRSAPRDDRVRWHGLVDANLRTAPGCDRCHACGYMGQAPVVQLLVPDDGLRDLIVSGPPNAARIRYLAMAAGMRTMLDHALELVRSGATSLDEVLRRVPLEPVTRLPK